MSNNKKVYFVPNRCLGCEECLLACAKAHEQSNAGDPKQAKYDFESRNFLLRIGIGGFPVPVRCAHCEEASCVAACPEDAIKKNDAGTVLIDYDKCIACGNCMVACPYGMIHQHPVTNKPVKCDLCTDRREAGISDEPACVTNCALEALVFATPEEILTIKEKKVSTKVLDQDDMVKQIMIPKEA